MKNQLVRGVGGAQVFSLEQIEQLAPDFSQHAVDVTDMNVNQFVNSFVNAVQKTNNRKAFPPGDVLSEIWRVVLEAQWLLPTVAFKWGVDHEGKFPVANCFHAMFKQLMATMHVTRCLPLQAVCNLGVTIPKKT